MTGEPIADPEAVLAQWRHGLDARTAAKVEAFCRPGAVRYALGRNEATELVAQGIALTAILEDRPAVSSWGGIPVISPELCDPAGICVNTVMAARPRTAEARLGSLSLGATVNYSDLMALKPSRFPAPEFVATTRALMQTDGPRYAAVRARLADPESVAAFDDVLKFRLTADSRYLQQYEVRFDEQYFEPFLSLPRSGGVFVDGGAFDGASTLELFRRHPQFDHAHLFEPSEANLATLRARLGHDPSVTIHPVGLSGSCQRVAFVEGQGASSKIDERGEARVEVDQLDSRIHGQVDFIKLDVEGWEMEALRGGRMTIGASRPELAVCVYHRASDFIEVPEFVLSLCSDYELRFRHYSEGWLESVMFFSLRGRSNH